MISTNVINIYETETALHGQEITDVLLRTHGKESSPDLRVERIVSNGISSPSDFWYDQDFNEWCCLVQGDAVLQIESYEVVYLKKGDTCFLPMHLKHRVASVSQDAVWITVSWN